MSETRPEPTIREVLLKAVEQLRGDGQQPLQQAEVVRVAARVLDPEDRRDLDLEQAVLTAWYDLFRDGHLAWGFNFCSPDPPHFHLTDKARRTLQRLSRDPGNPDGYLANLKGVAPDSVAYSYIREALRAYNEGLFKAAAVMAGCAAESLTLELRDALVAQMDDQDRKVLKGLQDWRSLTVFRALQDAIGRRKDSMDRHLREPFESYWPAFAQTIRAARNDAGHPSTIDPVTESSVHASLLVFPELAELTAGLKKWIEEGHRVPTGN